jgi:glycosyltransferase involved in cell wall biosynthesis
VKRQLIFLLPRIDKNVFSAQALLARQDLYASYLANRQGGSYQKAIAFYSGTDAPVDTHLFNFIKPIWLGTANLNLFSFFIKSIQSLKRIKDTRFILIAGTPFQPLMIARLINSRLSNSAIQVSIHGELASVRKSSFKYLFLKGQLSKVSRLRFVSEAQQNDFCKESTFAAIPSVITPVPIKIDPTLVNSDKRRNLGFVGRIHKERDPLSWVAIANSLPDMPKLVVGEGPLLDEMKADLKGGEFTGALDSAQLESVWPRINVLLSTAPYESYGLTIREALLHGVPVVAKNSAGARELASRFPKLVRLFEEGTQATALIHDLLHSPPTKDEFDSFKDWFVGKQEESLRALAELWDEM